MVIGNVVGGIGDGSVAVGIVVQARDGDGNDPVLSARLEGGVRGSVVGRHLLPVHPLQRTWCVILPVFTFCGTCDHFSVQYREFLYMNVHEFLSFCCFYDLERYKFLLFPYLRSFIFTFYLFYLPSFHIFPGDSYVCRSFCCTIFLLPCWYLFAGTPLPFCRAGGTW